MRYRELVEGVAAKGRVDLAAYPDFFASRR